MNVENNVILSLQSAIRKSVCRDLLPFFWHRDVGSQKPSFTIGVTYVMVEGGCFRWWLIVEFGCFRWWFSPIPPTMNRSKWESTVILTTSSLLWQRHMVYLGMLAYCFYPPSVQQNRQKVKKDTDFNGTNKTQWTPFSSNRRVMIKENCLLGVLLNLLCVLVLFQNTSKQLCFRFFPTSRLQIC